MKRVHPFGQNAAPSAAVAMASSLNSIACTRGEIAGDEFAHRVAADHFWDGTFLIAHVLGACVHDSFDVARFQQGTETADEVSRGIFVIRTDARSMLSKTTVAAPPHHESLAQRGVRRRPAFTFETRLRRSSG